MAETGIPIPFNHTGQFTIGTGMPGAPTLKALLSVPNNVNAVSGHGTLTQAVNPPLNANSSFHGIVTVDVFGAKVTQYFSLQGTALPPRVGATYVNHLSITLDGLWGKEGKASYSYVHGGVNAPIHYVENVPVKVVWLLQE